MKSTIKYFLTILLFLGFILPGCEPPCNCPDVLGLFFDIEDMAVKNYETTLQGGYILLEEGDVVDWADYTLSCEFEVDYFGFNKMPCDSRWSLMPAAYGCSCIANGQNGSMEKIADLNVITRLDFNSDFLKNDTINILLNYSAQGSNPINLDEFLAEDTSFIKSERFVLSLNTAPMLADSLLFDIILKLENGESYTVSNEGVRVQ